MSALEVDFVTHIQAQTDGPEISLDTATRIDDANYGIGAKTANRACEGGKSDWGRRKYEIIGAAFYSKKGAECSAAALKLRTNHPVQNAQAGCVEACHGTGRAGKPLGKGCSKVVIHLWLDLPPSRDID